MKKFITGIIFTIATTTAFANSGTAEYSTVQGLNGKPGGASYLVKFNAKFIDNVDWDFQMVSAQTDRSNSVSTRAELGLVPRLNLDTVRLSTKMAVGKRFNSTGESNYWTIEPSVAIPMLGGITPRIGWRYREAFNDSVLDTTRTLRLGVSYDITKKDVFTVRFDRVRGDTDQNTWNFAYTRRF